MCFTEVVKKDIEQIRQAKDGSLVPVTYEWVAAGMPEPTESEEEHDGKSA